MTRATKKTNRSKLQYTYPAEWNNLSAQERDIVEKILNDMEPPRNPNQEFSDHRTFGQRAADVIAKFGGSWTFILLFTLSLLVWAFVNTEILGPKHDAFDPYPYVFLNLILSMLAAVQAPIIMMSQNRQNMRDRLEAEIDHEVNVRAELAIHHMQQRIDLIENNLEKLLALLQHNRTSENKANA